MTDADRDAFSQIMATMVEVYQRPVTDSLLAIYFAALRDVPLDTVRVYAEHHLKSSRFFPTPCELRPEPPLSPELALWLEGRVQDRGKLQ